MLRCSGWSTDSGLGQSSQSPHALVFILCTLKKDRFFPKLKKETIPGPVVLMVAML